ncbi:MAG: YncE family protein [Opitutales bacterium]
MKNHLRLTFIPALLAGGFLAAPAAQAVPAPADYQVTATYAVGGAGGWDYLTVDAAHHLLFVPRSTHMLVLDATNGRTVADIPGQQRNHGVALVPAAGRGFITDGKDGSVVVFDLKTYAVRGKIKAAPDADGTIYDSASNRVLVVAGDAGTLVAIAPGVDLKTGHADAAVELGGKPEFLACDGQGKAYVNLVDQNQVAVVDTRTMQVLQHWSTAPGGAPVGMAIDRAHHRLFIGCRKPAKLIVMNADNGRIVADLPIGSGVDATAFDGEALASCGDGTVTVVRETAPDKFAVVQTVHTAPGARTMGVDELTHTIYLPTADLVQEPGKRRPTAQPGSFKILVVSR